MTFNYDRLLEAYLFESFSHQFDDESRAAKLVDEMDIVHLYGSVGSLPQLDSHRPDRSEADILSSPYAEAPRYEAPDVWKARADELETVHQHADDTFPLPNDLSTASKPECKTVPELIGSLGSNDRLIFLGFGFDEDNLNRLGCDQFREEFDKSNYPNILGTGYELPGITRRRLHSYFESPNRSSYEFRIGRANTKTLDFVDEFGVLHGDTRIDVVSVE